MNGTAHYIHNDEYGNYGSRLKAYSSDGRYSFEYNFGNSGEKILTTSSGTYNQAITPGYVKSSSKFPVFCTWREYSQTSAQRTGSQRIFSLKMTQGETVTRNLIPALRNSDGVAGMFDAVSKQFFTNAGTGTFGYRVKGAPATYSLRDPHRVAPSGVWARLAADGTLDAVAETELDAEQAEAQGYAYFANTADAAEVLGATEQNLV